MNLKKFLFMSLCLVLGALYLWKYENEHPAVQETNVTKVDIFPGLTPENTTKLSVVRPGSSYSLVRSEGAARWQLRRPEGARADEGKIASMLKALSALKSQNVLEKGEVDADQSIYGLQPPDLVLTVEGSYGKKVVSFGKKLPISGRRYLQPENDGRVFLVEEPIFALFNIDPDQVRDHLPIRFEAEKIDQLEVSRTGKEPLTFTRAADGWKVQFEGGGFRVDDTLMASKLNDLRRVRVKSFVDEPSDVVALYGLAKPRVVVKLHGTGAFEGGAESLTIEIGEGISIGTAEQEGLPAVAASTGYYIRLSGDPIVYEVARPFYGEFLQPPEYFRPRSPFASLKGKIERIDLELGGKAAGTLKRSGEKWELEEDGKEVPAASDRTNGWLNTLHDLRVVSYGAIKDSANPETGLQNPAAKYRIILKDRPAPLLILLGGAVHAADASNEPGASSESGEQAPRWIAVSQEDGALVPAIIDHGTYEQLYRDRQYFAAVEVERPQESAGETKSSSQ